MPDSSSPGIWAPWLGEGSCLLSTKCCIQGVPPSTHSRRAPSAAKDVCYAASRETGPSSPVGQQGFTGRGFREAICLHCSVIASARDWVPRLSGWRYMPTASRMSWQWDLLCGSRKNPAYAVPVFCLQVPAKSRRAGFFPDTPPQ